MILVATDFSQAANNAVLYACHLGLRYHLPLTVVHTYSIPFVFNETPLPIVTIEESKGTAVQEMKKLIAELENDFPDLEIHASVLYGTLTEALMEYEKNHALSIIILGNSGSGDNSLWWGSNVLNAFKNLKTPVLAIPEQFRFQDVNKICFTADCQVADQVYPLDSIKKWLSRCEAQLHILHVATGEEDRTKCKAESERLKQIFSTIPYDYHEAKNEDINHTLATFPIENEMDWLILMPRKHGFFYHLFDKSHTAEMIERCNIPILGILVED